MGAEDHSGTREIIKVTVILAVITIFEIILAYNWPDKHESTSRIRLNSLFIILTVFKAFFIMGEFMHLKYEYKSLIWTIVVPFTLFIWFVIAFLWDGGSWLNYRGGV